MLINYGVPFLNLAYSAKQGNFDSQVLLFATGWMVISGLLTRNGDNLYLSAARAIVQYSRLLFIARRRVLPLTVLILDCCLVLRSVTGFVARHN